MVFCLIEKWFNFHYRYTGRVLFIDDSEPALGAGGREFESLHPDRRQYHLSLIKPSVKRGLSFYHIYSYLIKYIPKSDTGITDTLKTQSKNSTKKDPPSPWEAPPRLIYMLLLHKTGENVSGDIINATTHIV